MVCPKVAEGEVGLSEDGKTPCELCAIIDSLRILIAETAKEVKQLEPVKAYARMRMEFLKLQQTHKKCPGCGLCFGGFHIALPVYVEGIGDVCQWCAKDIKQVGLEKFMRKLKQDGR